MDHVHFPIVVDIPLGWTPRNWLLCRCKWLCRFLSYCQMMLFCILTSNEGSRVFPQQNVFFQFLKFPLLYRWKRVHQYCLICIFFCNYDFGFFYALVSVISFVILYFYEFYSVFFYFLSLSILRVLHLLKVLVPFLYHILQIFSLNWLGVFCPCLEWFC